MELIVKQLLEILKESIESKKDNYDLTIDVRKIIIDSIAYIRFLADIEEKFNIDLDFEEINGLNIVSINALAELINAHIER